MVQPVVELVFFEFADVKSTYVLRVYYEWSNLEDSVKLASLQCKRPSHVMSPLRPLASQFGPSNRAELELWYDSEKKNWNLFLN